MPYTLARLAPGSYDALLDRVIVTSLVRSTAPWTAELLADVHPRRRPAPFIEAEPTFGSPEDAETWLEELRSTTPVVRTERKKPQACPNSHPARDEQEGRGEAPETYPWNTFSVYESTRQFSTKPSFTLSRIRTDTIRIWPLTICG
jgi:hypothetical protein